MGLISFVSLSLPEYSLLAEEMHMPLYAQAYWLEAAAPGAMRYFAAYRGDRLQALSPLFFPTKNILLTPPSCQCGGLFFLSPDSENLQIARKQFTYRRHVLEAFARCFSPVRYMQLSLPSSVKDALPFYWQGARLFHRYNYCLRLPGEGGSLERCYNQDIRQKLKQARCEGLSCSYEDSPLAVKSLMLRHAASKSIPRVYISAQFRIIQAALSRKKGFLLSLRGSGNFPLGFAFVAIEGETAYLIASGIDPEVSSLRYPHAFLLHAAIQASLERGVSLFDFEGSMLRGVEATFRAMGGEQSYYLQVEKGNLDILRKCQLKRYYSSI